MTAPSVQLLKQNTLEHPGVYSFRPHPTHPTADLSGEATDFRTKGTEQPVISAIIVTSTRLPATISGCNGCESLPAEPLQEPLPSAIVWLPVAVTNTKTKSSWGRNRLFSLLFHIAVHHPGKPVQGGGGALSLDLLSLLS